MRGLERFFEPCKRFVEVVLLFYGLLHLGPLEKAPASKSRAGASHRRSSRPMPKTTSCPCYSKVAMGLRVCRRNFLGHSSSSSTHTSEHRSSRCASRF